MPHDEIPERRPLRGVSRQFFNGGKGIEAPFAHHVRYGLPHGVLQHVILRVLPSQGNMPVLFYIGGKGFARLCNLLCRQRLMAGRADGFRELFRVNRTPAGTVIV